MSEVTPHYAPIVVLLFLGSAALIVASLIVLLYAAVRKSSRFAAIGGSSLLTTVFCYGTLLMGTSLLSREIILPAGGSKYFCEIDCHLAYSIAGTQTAATLGMNMQQTPTKGKFVVVRVKTWFDPSTISPHRGDGPLTPNARRVLLTDDTGHSYSISLLGQTAVGQLPSSGAPLTQSLRPGESYTSDLVFDVARDARGLRLLVIEDDPETRFVIGHENSLLHKKIYLGLDSAPTLTGVPLAMESH